MKRVLSQYRYIFVLYLLVAIAIFFQLLISKGCILGGDWGLPSTQAQTNSAFHTSLFTWAYSGNPFGIRQTASVSLIFNSVLKFINLFGIDSSFTAKAFLTLLFAFAAANMNYYLRTKFIKPVVAFIGGLLFITTPIFFNYSLMGWIFVLLSLSLLPLFVVFCEKYLATGKFKYGFWAALVMSLAVLQSQSIVWYPLVFMVLVLTNSINLKELKKNSGRFLIVMGEFLLINSYWLFGLLFLPDKYLFSANIVNSTISIGTSARLSAENILRLWGNLFNYQYESSFPAILSSVSFIIPLLAIAAGFFYRNRRSMIVFLFVLYLVPFVMFWMPRQFLALIPFSALIRDVARFAVLSSFGAVALVCITLDNLDLKKRTQKWGLIFCFALLFLNASPFWLGRLYGYNQNDHDFKFRTYQWPAEYILLEDKLSQEKSDQKALFLPFGGIISSITDLRFNGAYREMQDISAGFSNIPGVVVSSDKSQGASSNIINQIAIAIDQGDYNSFNSIINRTNINFLILRRDLLMPDDARNKLEAYMRAEVDAGSASEYLNQGQIFAIHFNQPKGEVTLISSRYDVADIVTEVIRNQFPDSADQILASTYSSPITNIADIFDLVPPHVSLTYKDQNNIFAPSDADGLVLPFISSKAIERTLIKENLLQQDWEIENVLAKSGERFFTYSSNDSASGTLYFDQSAISVNNQFLLNGQVVSRNGEIKNGRYLVSEVQLKKGVNVIEGTSLTPIAFIIANNQLQELVLSISYKKVNPTKYEVTIVNAPESFMLDLRESFNSYWTIYSSDNSSGQFKINPGTIAGSKHLVGNGYSNLFVIKDNRQDALKVTIEFWPQRLFYLLSAISAVFLLLFITIAIRNEHKS